MAWTKRELIMQAFEEIGLAQYAYDINPEQLMSALRRLDAMVANWSAIGVTLGYPMPPRPNESNLDDDSGVPSAANEAVYLNLALRIAPVFGKVPSEQTKQFADIALKNLMAKLADPLPRTNLPEDMPVGAGYKRNTYPFTPPPPDGLDLDGGNELEL